jgi:hypothetical protein
MGGQSASSKSFSLAKTKREVELQDTQLAFARQALDAFNDQYGFQTDQRGLAAGATRELGGVQDLLNALPQEERASFVRDIFNQSLAGGRRAGEISDIELERIRSGGVATPQQRAVIAAGANAELASGLGDIQRFAAAQREQIGSELAPRLGLHRTDTPILDRGNRIAASAVDAAGRLSSDVRGRQAQANLNYPLAASQANVAQQGIGFSRSDVVADLNQRAFQNRLALTGQTGQQGLGLATGFNAPAAQQSFAPTIVESSKSSGGGVLYSSSRNIKEVLSTPDGAEILEKIESLPVTFWKYLTDEDHDDHVGPFAEDFLDAFGLGDGTSIDLRDMAGVLLVGLQELAGQVKSLRAEEDA